MLPCTMSTPRVSAPRARGLTLGDATLIQAEAEHSAAKAWLGHKDTPAHWMAYGRATALTWPLATPL